MLLNLKQNFLKETKSCFAKYTLQLPEAIQTYTDSMLNLIETFCMIKIVATVSVCQLPSDIYLRFSDDAVSFGMSTSHKAILSCFLIEGMLRRFLIESFDRSLKYEKLKLNRIAIFILNGTNNLNLTELILFISYFLYQENNNDAFKLHKVKLL